MNEPFADIFRFLEQFEPQVAGRAYEPLDPATRAKVQAFARGELPAAEHEPFIRQLQADPALVGLLTETVKGMRGDEQRQSRASATSPAG